MEDRREQIIKALRETSLGRAGDVEGANRLIEEIADTINKLAPSLTQFNDPVREGAIYRIGGGNIHSRPLGVDDILPMLETYQETYGDDPDIDIRLQKLEWTEITRQDIKRDLRNAES